MLQLKEYRWYYVFCVDGYERKTDKALLAIFDAHTKVWIPRSQCLAWEDSHGNKFIALPYWLANDNGLLNKNWNGSDAYAFITYSGSELRYYLYENGLEIPEGQQVADRKQAKKNEEIRKLEAELEQAQAKVKALEEQLHILKQAH